eukprot:gb/GEZN01004135.1/.p1 GENE.gb/GEZN01004135.1/~~gb/GEZN01004135.1/.p1  ORF type:complete len:517 (-),score=52.92 gb/GEZN01004135.1/:469-1998(-)
MTTQKRGFSVVVAATTLSNGIGFKGALPWPPLKGDMAFFKKITSEAPAECINAVIMGRKTWESIPAKFRPLRNRLNIVISSQGKLRHELSTLESVVLCSSFMEAVTVGRSNNKVSEIFIIGGGQIYKEALQSAHCQTIYLTQVLKQFECDTFLPTIDMTRFSVVQTGEISTENGVPYQILTLEAISRGKMAEAKAGDRETATPLKKNKSLASPVGTQLSFAPAHEEQQYLDLIKDIIACGNERGDRTGVGTMSRFGAQFRFSLDGHFPLLTTKRVFFRGVAEELFWMMRGSTDAQQLSSKGIKIWDGNGSRDFLDKSGFADRREGDLGPVYGFQWRHFGAEYKGPDAEYEGKGHDQLEEIIRLIKSNPDSRRIVMSAWNAKDINSMALPPCHVMAQFYVHDKKLSCHLYQRSADLGLGVPFNIASYSLLTYLIAHFTGLTPGEFIHSFGDAHVYANHIEPLREQLKREPRPFPTLRIKPGVKDIYSVQFSDLELEGYKPHGTIKMEMAV